MVREALILDVLQFVYGMDPVAFVVEVDSIKPWLIHLVIMDRMTSVAGPNE